MRLFATLLAAGLLALAAVLPAGAVADLSSRAQSEAGTAALLGKRLPRLAGQVRVAKRHHRHLRRGVRSATKAPTANGGAADDGGSSKPGSSQTPSQPIPTPPPTPKPAPTPVTAPSLQPTPEAPATDSRLLFSSNFDGSFSGWCVQSLPGRAAISSTHPFAGSGAARLEVRPGDVEPDTGSQRSEVSGPTFSAGQDIFVRDAIRVPDGYSYQGPWQLIDQLHETNWGGSPGIATFLDSNRRISFGAGDSSPTYWRGPVLEPERWYLLVYRVKLARDPAQGFVEVWLDGVQQVLLNGATRMYGETIQTDQTYLKAGIYRSSSSTGVSIVEHDSVAVGTSLAAVSTS